MVIGILAVFRCINKEDWLMETIKDENIRKMLLESISVHAEKKFLVIEKDNMQAM